MADNLAAISVARMLHEQELFYIGQKLQLYKMTLTPTVVDAALARARTDWERDLRPLLGQYVNLDVTDRAAATLLRLAVSASEGDGPAGGRGG
ncbi:MAG: hypothetical protein WAV53_20490 [Anaerolineae bacterium]